MANISKQGHHVTIDGVRHIIKGIYDGGTGGINSSDAVGHMAARNYGRYRLDFLLHIHTGTFGNGLRFADAARAYNMYAVAVGNFFSNFTFDPALFANNPMMQSFDVVNNSSYLYNGVTAPFRTHWIGAAGALCVYPADEPFTTPVGWYESDPLINPNHYRFDSNISGWTINALGGTGSVTWNAGINGNPSPPAGGEAVLVGGTNGVEFSITITPKYKSQLNKAYFTIRSGNVRVRYLAGATTLVDETFAPGAAHRTVTTTQSDVTMIFSVLPGVTAQVDLLGLSPAGDPPPVPSTRGLDCTIFMHQFMKSAMPTVPTLIAFLNDDVYQYRSWFPNDIGDWNGSDIYTIGQAPETDPGNSGTLGVTTYGYMNFPVAEAASLARYYCEQYNRIPLIILQILKFGVASRFITRAEVFSHWIIAMAEMRARGIYIWWAFGNQNYALDHTTSVTRTANGTDTAFAGGVYAEEAGDITVRVNNVLQDPSAYTLTNMADATLHRPAGTWTYQNLPTVNFPAPPANGSAINIVIKTYPTGKANVIRQMIEDVTKFMSDNELLLMDNGNPNFVVGNSTWQADFITWRKAHCNVLRQNPGANRPCWLFGYVNRYTDEYNKLNLATPDTTLSVHMQDSVNRGNVRHWAWVGSTFALVAAYNMNPDQQIDVELTFAQSFVRCEVLFENRDISVLPGNKVRDTFGGSTSLRQGPFQQGHFYKLHFYATPPSQTRPKQPGCGYGYRGQVICNAA